jgi:hypothetical protein
MRCELAYENFVYHVEKDCSIDIVRYRRGHTVYEWNTEFGGDALPEVPVTLVPIPHRVEFLFQRLNQGGEISDEEEKEVCEFTRNFANLEVGGYPIVDVINQFGGRSFLCQRLRDPLCIRCKREMRFLASLTNDDRESIKITFAGVQIVFFICVKCVTIQVQHSV